MQMKMYLTKFFKRSNQNNFRSTV